MPFSRKIKLSDPILPFKTPPTDEPPDAKLSDENVQALMNNCHWGALKLFYSELEFLNLVNKYIDVNECLVVYIGAQPGFRLKHLFVKKFFPKLHMLLYDPRKFDITETDQITIRSGIDNGWFSDEKIPEVLKYANGRKILYISDIRITNSEDEYDRENLIHNDMQIQQKWGVMMGAEFMLLKFRMFFYKRDPKEVNFIDNSLPESYSDKIIYTKDDSKHKDIHNWLLYLDGSIYTQLYATIRSTETRLFVKKIKYYKDANKYTAEQQEKYKMRYYDNILYEGLLNYYNLKIRTQPIVYKRSDEMTKYILGQTVSYTTASEYYIMRQYVKSLKKKPTFKRILNLVANVYIFLMRRYNNNLVKCGKIKLLTDKKKSKLEEEKKHYEYVKTQIATMIDDIVKNANIQVDNIKQTKWFTQKKKDKLLNSYRFEYNEFFIYKNQKFIKISK
jgi:hypothetical protein